MRQTANSLAELWIEGVADLFERTPRVDEVEAALEHGFAAAHSRYPDIAVSDEELLLYALARCDGPEVFSGERMADLLIACALQRGDAAALRTFDARLVPLVTPSLQKLRLDKNRLDEIMQRVRVDLFIASGDAPPRIAQYRGRGDLVGWLKVTATRLALRAQKSDQRGDSDDQVLERLPDQSHDSEQDLLRARYKAPFREAFREAITNLDDRERTILRQHHADGMSIDALAPIHGVHRATVARWIVAAERNVLDHTRARFRELLAATPAECESVMRLLRGELSMSLRWLSS